MAATDVRYRCELQPGHGQAVVQDRGAVPVPEHQGCERGGRWMALHGQCSSVTTATAAALGAAAVPERDLLASVAYVLHAVVDHAIVSPDQLLS